MKEIRDAQLREIILAEPRFRRGLTQVVGAGNDVQDDGYVSARHSSRNPGRSHPTVRLASQTLPSGAKRPTGEPYGEKLPVRFGGRVREPLTDAYRVSCEGRRAMEHEMAGLHPAMALRSVPDVTGLQSSSLSGLKR